MQKFVTIYTYINDQGEQLSRYSHVRQIWWYISESNS